MVSTTGRGPQRIGVELEEKFKKELSVERLGETKLDFSVATTSCNGSLMANTTKAAITLPRTNIRIARRIAKPLDGVLGITGFDISPVRGGQYVAGGEDAKALVGTMWDDTVEQNVDETERSPARPKAPPFRCSAGDVRSARFFPDGQRVLTTSSGCTIDVHSVEGKYIANLTGHRRAVLDCAIFEDNTRFLSGSSDGSVRLWDAAKEVCIASFTSENFSEVQTLALNTSNVGRDSIFLAGLSSGTVEMYDLRSRSCVSRLQKQAYPAGPPPKASDSWEQTTSGAIESLAFHTDRHRLLAGCRNGVTMMYDDRMLSSSTTTPPSTPFSLKGPVACWRRNGAAVNNIAFLPSGQEAVLATSDGTPYRVSLRGEHPKVTEEYCGWEGENVGFCRVDAKERIWLAGSGGLVRVYD